MPDNEQAGLQRQFEELSNKITLARIKMEGDGPENDPEQQAEIDKMRAELDDIVAKIRGSA